MAYLLDTDIVIDLLFDSAEVRFLVDAMAEQSPAMSIITYIEAYEGVSRADRPRRFADRFERLVRDIPVVPLTLASAQR